MPVLHWGSQSAVWTWVQSQALILMNDEERAKTPNIRWQPRDDRDDCVAIDRNLRTPFLDQYL